MKTNKKYIKHINDRLYKGAKAIHLGFTKFNGRVYFENTVIQNWDSPNGCCEFKFDLTETEWKNWLNDFREILTELGVIEKLTVREFTPKVSVGLGNPVWGNFSC